MNLAAVEALKHIATGFNMLADAMNPNATVAGVRPDKGSHISGDPVDDQEEDEPFPAGQGEAPADEEQSEVELKDLQAAAKKLITSDRREDLKKVLAKFKIPNLSSAEEKDYPAILAALEK